MYVKAGAYKRRSAFGAYKLPVKVSALKTTNFMHKNEVAMTPLKPATWLVRHL